MKKLKNYNLVRPFSMADIQSKHLQYFDQWFSLHDSLLVKKSLARAIGFLHGKKVGDLFSVDYSTPERSFYSLVVDGPLRGFYSLAIVNRHLASAFHAAGVNTLVTSKNERLDDDLVSQSYAVVRNSYIADLVSSTTYIHLFNSWPPDPSHLTGAINGMHCFAWEETVFPRKYVLMINKSLDFVGVTSVFVRDALINSGVTVPVFITGNGIPQYKSSLRRDLPKSKFTFLHISSCFARKGVEELIHGFCLAFTKADNVRLIIKTFDNPDNVLDSVLGELLPIFSDHAEIRVIKANYSDDQLDELLDAADYVVYPTRGEGFLLPAAEAMAKGIPVITTSFGGQTDFCTRSTSLIVKTSLWASESHVCDSGSMWARADVSDLAHTLRLCYSGKDSEVSSRVARAKQLIADVYNWKAVAFRTEYAASVAQEAIANRQNNPIRVVILSSWSQKCGIATYTANLVKNYVLSGNPRLSIISHSTSEIVKDEKFNVFRLWDGTKAGLHQVCAKVQELKPSIFLIESHLGHYSYTDTEVLIEACFNVGTSVIVEFHSDVTNFRPPASTIEKLRRCRKLIVHTAKELQYLWSMGVCANVVYIDHPVPIYEGYAGRPLKCLALSPDVPLHLGTFGFMMPHKRYDLVLDAIKILKDMGLSIQLSMFNSITEDPKTVDYLSWIRGRVIELGLADIVNIKADFMPMCEVLAELDRCDILIFPYEENGEAASGAVTEVMQLQKPLILSPASIFNSLESISHRFSEYSGKALAESIYSVVTDRQGVAEKLDKQRAYVEALSWQNFALRLNAIALGIQDEFSFAMNTLPISPFNKL